MMFYEIAGRGIFVSPIYSTSPIYYLVIDTLELAIDYNSNKLLYVQGYFPLDRVQRATVSFQNYVEGDFRFSDRTKEVINKKEMELAIPHDYFSVFPDSMKVFTFENRVFDEDKKVIRFGVDNSSYAHVKINNNLLVSVDRNNELKCICIKPDKFI